MGTPSFAATILDDLAEQHDVVAAYTRADAVRGRGKGLVPSPVKEVAERRGIDVRTPQTLRDLDEVQALASLKPDVICVAAYGMILPKEVLAVPSFGCLNVHASLLPRWRGAAPVERAILAGDEEAGVCVMRMEEGLDTGAYCVSRSLEIGSLTATDLTAELADLGASALLTALVHVERGAARWIDQDESLVTYASKIAKGELDVSPSDKVVSARRKVQASSEAHPSRAMIGGRRVTLGSVAEVPADEEGASGIAAGGVRFAAKRLYLGVSDGAVEVLRVKPDGKQEMDGRAFAAGLQGVKQGKVTWEGTRG